MRKHFSAFAGFGMATLLSLTLTCTSHAQKYSPLHYSVTGGLLSVSRNFSDNRTDLGLASENKYVYGLHIGADIPLVKLSPEQTIGLSLNAGGLTPSSQNTGWGLDAPILITLPEYVTWRMGARSSRKSQKDFGLGIGLGYRFGFAMMPAFHAPSAMIEGAYITPRRDFFLRFTSDLTSVSYTQPEENPLISKMTLRTTMLSFGFTL